MQFFEILKLVLSLLPLIQQLVAQAEQLFPQAGAGAHKLAVVKGAIGAAYETGSQAETTFEQVWPAVNSVITNIVAAKKALSSGNAESAA